MKSLIQRVAHASVMVDDRVVGKIGPGALVLVGLEVGDTQADLDYHTKKLSHMRYFPDAQGRMNLSVADAGGSLLVVSQFTLAADVHKGNRPGFTLAMAPDEAKLTFARFLDQLRAACGVPVETGEFGAHMKVELLNDGPVTFLIDSRSGQPL
ncbi:MAG: D-tyrosyl-tRNA(Tyr) deacylase [Cyanobacteria bacterium HKST-UBA04]|nr:D-tyrosyl-tRNA(Tyr) deacylase [Cyanobacteria bacterium HKST-UBA04]